MRAIEPHWIPRHATALRLLEPRLDEVEREEAVRRRWVTARRAD